MGAVRIVGDRVFSVERHGVREAVPLVAPVLAAAQADEARPRLDIDGPRGRITIHPRDYVKRDALYEGLARADGLAVRAVWWIVHAGAGLRGCAILDRNRDGALESTIYLNVLQPCVLHRLHTFEHELSHVRERDSLKNDAHSDAIERRCDEAGTAKVIAAARLAQRSATCAIDEMRCARCARDSEAACPQGLDVFTAVNAALKPL